MSYVPWQGELARAQNVQEQLKALKKSSHRRLWLNFRHGPDLYLAFNSLVIPVAIATIWFVAPYFGTFVRYWYPRITDHLFRFSLTPRSFEVEQVKVLEQGERFDSFKDGNTRNSLLRFYKQTIDGIRQDQSLLLIQWKPFKHDLQSGCLKFKFNGNAKPQQGIGLLYNPDVEHGQNAYREVFLEKDPSNYLTGGIFFWKLEKGERLVLLVKTTKRDPVTGGFPAANSNGYEPEITW